MATTKSMDNTISVKKAEKKPTAPVAKVSVFIPMKVPRGQWVDVTVPVFVQLRNRYPNL